MEIIQSLSRKLARSANSLNGTEQDAQVYGYALTVILLNATAVGGIVLLAWLLGTLKVTLITWAAAFSLRIFTGGHHQAVPLMCWVLTVAVFTAAGYAVALGAPVLKPHMHIISAAGLIFALHTTVAYAPVTISTKQFTPEKRWKLKIASIVVLVLWTTIALNPTTLDIAHTALCLAITTGLVIQSISLLPLKRG